MSYFRHCGSIPAPMCRAGRRAAELTEAAGHETCEAKPVRDGSRVNGLQLFLHSLHQVTGNFAAAIRISALLYLAQVAVVSLTDLSLLTDEIAMRAAIEAGSFPWGRLLLVLLVAIVVNLWIAVSWHRYVLRVEMPTTLVPRFRAGPMVSYFGKMVALGLLLAIPMMILMGVTGPVAAGGGALGSLVVVVAVAMPVSVLFFRISPVLPAAALGTTLKFSQAWARTAGATGALAGLAMLFLVASLVIDLPAAALPRGSVPELVWLGLTGWVKAMVGISILTTIYGHYIEGRALR